MQLSAPTDRSDVTLLAFLHYTVITLSTVMMLVTAVRLQHSSLWLQQDVFLCIIAAAAIMLYVIKVVCILQTASVQ